MSNHAVQVGVEHYAWGSYTDKARWCSYWHQVDEVLKAGAETCVEIGTGTGDVRHQLTQQGVTVTTVDIDPDLGVDRVGSVTDLPCEDNEFDVSLCAQVLEHLPWADVPAALSELARVSRKKAIVSLPQSGRVMRLMFSAPIIGTRDFFGRTPGIKTFEFNGQHYWQVGAKGARRSDVRRLMEVDFTIDDEYMVRENPYHRFYVLTPRTRP